MTDPEIQVNQGENAPQAAPEVQPAPAPQPRPSVPMSQAAMMAAIYASTPPAPQPQPQAPKKEESRKPVVSIIMTFVAMGFLFIHMFIVGYQVGNKGLDYLFYLLVFAGLILMLLGLLIKKLPLFFGIGFLLLAVDELRTRIPALVKGTSGVLTYVGLILAVAFILVGLHFLLKGKGINKTVKTIFCIIGIALEFGMFIYVFIINFGEMMIVDPMRFFMLYGSGRFLLRIIMEDLVFILAFVAALLFNPFNKKAEEKK